MQIAEALALKLESESPREDLELLLIFVLQCQRSYLYTWPEKELSAEQEHHFRALLNQRMRGVPVAHLTGLRGFWTFELEVNDQTLIPRPETELLVETALQLALPDDARVLDLGTGTGAIALALASERSGWKIQASDRIPGAIELATRNRNRLGLSHIEFVTGSWFEPISGYFDLIVSNPPYIASDDPHLVKGDLRFEPQSALVAPENGLADLERIILDARLYLNPCGWLVLEHGYEQADAVCSRFQDAGYTHNRTVIDLNGHPRVSLGQWSGLRC